MKETPSLEARLRCLAALLQQLAAQAAEIADLKGRALRANKRKTRHKQRAEAAERAREEACGLLREASKHEYAWEERGYHDCRLCKHSAGIHVPIHHADSCLYARIAAFLAANGGQHG